ncbi:hypothetical protein [Psychrobacter sp. K31L]|uniref:hypothetical protein n=1 Tax=Psychrobacter sp. K31L TaxID=2820758 RepID=UPI001B33F065|nr:hypothetical protein [Psychrobacter sp. K31L]MBP3944694.1 hypothetical protein [Psychrobacter sp. K31L]
MPLRPIDAIFVHPKQRLYVVYYRGDLWQLPRMKIDDRSWQNRRPYKDDSSSLYLSIHQAISDPLLAQKLRTLDLPVAVRGSTLPRFEAWWEAHGFKWLKDRLLTGESPLAAHTETGAINDGETDSTATLNSKSPSVDNKSAGQQSRVQNSDTKKVCKQDDNLQAKDVFADMLADLVEEVLYK